MHSFLKLHFALLFLVIGISACANETTEDKKSELPESAKNLTNLTVYPEDPEPEYEIELIAEQDFGGSDSIYISYVSDIISDEENRVIIADGARGKCKIHVFNPDGSYLRTVGRNGRGPGEFIAIKNLFILNNKLFVLDHHLKRISVFSLSSFELLDTINTHPNYLKQMEDLGSASPLDFHLRDDGNFLVGFADQILIQENDIRKDTKYFIFNNEWEIISEQIFSRPPHQYYYSNVGNRPSLRTYSFMNQSLMDVAADGTIFSAWSEDFLIKVHDTNGNYLRSIYYPFNYSRLNKDDIINKHDEYLENSPEGIKRWKDVAQTVDYPDFWPAIQNLIVDDKDRIWVATKTDSKTEFEWWVLNNQGKLLAKFNWPGEKVSQNIGNGKTMKIRNGYLYTYIFQEEDASRLVTRYLIDLTPK
ncbi:6-bladed beta-propeller [Gracilimonas sp.]|uniref:6-bladed beta-propeller n=1 Tax=Gracilimonas sp. TaxID=1974203 RepID=UPI00287285A8|nr:6-bladed beta-propeller [Gracilimonas sp.]